MSTRSATPRRPSTIRAAALPGTRVDAGPTWTLIDDLIARGWPKTWIAKEAGLGVSLQLNRHMISAANAQKIADLHARVGPRRTAPRGPEAVPPLEQILAGERDSAGAA